MTRFAAARWSTVLKAASAVSVVVFLAIALLLPRGLFPGLAEPWRQSADALLHTVPLAVLAIATLFVVRGYRLERGELVVRRLYWETRVPLAGLTAAWHDPRAMRRSVRMFGNGGLFSITGLYYNRALGRYRAFVTNPAAAVVLRARDRVVVVTPERPDAFLRAVGERFPGVSLSNPGQKVD